MSKRVKCIRCDGKGRIDMHVCGCCDGDGWYYEEETESVGEQFSRTTRGREESKATTNPNERSADDCPSYETSEDLEDQSRNAKGLRPRKH